MNDFFHEINKLVFIFRRDNPYSPEPKFLILSTKKRNELHAAANANYMIRTGNRDEKPSEVCGLIISVLDGGYDTDIMEVR